MFLRFEDWSQQIFTSRLRGKIFDHGGQEVEVKEIIKVYASEMDPRVVNRGDLAVYKMSSEPLTSYDTFNYDLRGIWDGEQVEEFFRGFNLDERGKGVARALFRFSNLPALGLCQTAMTLRGSNGEWLVDHPARDIDFGRIGENGQDLHLDVFIPESVGRLRNFLVENFPEGDMGTWLISLREAMENRKKMLEGQTSFKERER